MEDQSDSGSNSPVQDRADRLRGNGLLRAVAISMHCQALSPRCFPAFALGSASVLHRDTPTEYPLNMTINFRVMGLAR